MLICAKIVGHKPDHLLLSQSSIAAELCYYTIDLAMPRRKPKSSPAEKESSSEPGRSHLQEEERKQSAVDAVKDSPDGASFSGQSDPEQPPPTVKRLKEENESERELPIKKKPRGKPKVESKEELETKMAKKEEAYPAEESGGELPIKKKARGKQKVEPKEELMEKKMAKEEETHPAEESGGELPIKKKAKGKQKVEPKEELMEKKMAKEEETHPAEESGGELPIKKKAKGKQKGEAKEELMEKEESHLTVTQKAATQKATMRKGKGKGVTKLPDQEHGEEEGDAVEPLPQKQFWLMKSEPESRMQKGVNVKFSIEDLQNEPDQTTCWDGVRSYPGRNIMRDKMQVGDLAFFYHSNCKEPGIVGGSFVNRALHDCHTVVAY